MQLYSYRCSLKKDLCPLNFFTLCDQTDQNLETWVIVEVEGNGMLLNIFFSK